MLSATMGQHEPLLAMDEIRLPLPDNANAKISVDTSSKVSDFLFIWPRTIFIAQLNYRYMMIVDKTARSIYNRSP